MKNGHSITGFDKEKGGMLAFWTSALQTGIKSRE